MKDVDYLSFFFTTLTGAHTHITFNDMSTDSILDIDKTVFPWSCASGFSSEILRALQDTDEDGLLPSSTLSPLSVFATTLEQFLHHWDVVEVIFSLSLSFFYLPVSFSTFSCSSNFCQLFCCQSLAYVSNPAVIRSVPREYLCPLTSALSVSLACVNHLVALVSVRSSVCCWLDAFALHGIFTCHKTTFLTSNIK